MGPASSHGKPSAQAKPSTPQHTLFSGALEAHSRGPEPFSWGVRDVPLTAPRVSRFLFFCVSTRPVPFQLSPPSHQRTDPIVSNPVGHRLGGVRGLFVGVG